MTAALSPRRQRTRERKVDAIVNIAMSLVADQGLEGLTLHKIAAAMDWVPGTLYRYFSSKDVLLAELQARVLMEYGEAQHAQLSRYAPEESLLALLLMAQHYVNWFQKRPGHHALIAMGLAHPKALLSETTGQPVLRAAMGVLTQANEVFVQSAQQGFLQQGNSIDRTLAYWASVQGVLQMHKLARFAPDTFNVDRVLLEAIHTLLLGWGAKPSQLEQTMTTIEQGTSP